MKVDRFALLLVTGRLCARRSHAIGALARSQARGAELEAARAHLAHCRDCLLTFRAYRAALSRRVAAVLPMPALALAGHDGRVLGPAHDLMLAAKRQAYALAGRGPKTSTGAEAVAGAGAGASGAMATKLVVGLCVTAAAGGGAVCVQSFGLFGGAQRPAGRTADKHDARTSETAKSPISPAATHDPPPAVPAAATRAQSTPSTSTSSATSQSSTPSQSKQEFFDAPNGSGASPTTKSTAVHSASSGSTSSRSGKSSGKSSGGGSSEFFGG
jgi:uncharacterized membrane protein YgcG